MDKFALKKEARNIIKKNFSNVILAVGINILTTVIYAILFTFILKNTDSLVYQISSFVYIVISFPISFGVTKYLLNIINNKKRSFKDIFYYYSHQLLDVIIVSIIRSIAITLGLSLCLFPGIIIYFMLVMVENILVENKSKALSTIKDSIKMMRGHKWDYCNFVISFMGIPFLCIFLITVIRNNIFVEIALCLSILIVIPYLSVSSKLYYNELKKLK